MAIRLWAGAEEAGRDADGGRDAPPLGIRPVHLICGYPCQVVSIVAAYLAGLREPEAIARAALCEKPRASDLQMVRDVLANPSLQGWLQHGLPRHVHARLEDPVRCRSCGRMIVAFPCVACAAEGWQRARKRRASRSASARPASATTAAPGSREKIEVMRQRVSAGKSCFHPDDPWFEDRRSRRPKRPVTVVSTQYLRELGVQDGDLLEDNDGHL